ncbi:hypothetical protein N9V86_04095 [Opitutales bacterium]|nr:hypothetical protein [Opitutales bacterium]
MGTLHTIQKNPYDLLFSRRGAEPNHVLQGSLTATPTSNQQPTTNNLQPSTSNQQPSTFNLQPSTSNQQRSTSNPKLVEGRRVTDAACNEPVESGALWATKEQQVVLALRHATATLASALQIMRLL